MEVRSASAYATAGVMVTTSTASGRHFPATRSSVVRYVRRQQAPLPFRVASAALVGVLCMAIVVELALVVASCLGFQSYAISSMSSDESVPTGSLVIVDTNVPYDADLAGSTVAARSDGTVMAGRVASSTDEGHVVQADGVDMIMGEDRYVGVIRFALPGAGILLSTLGTVWGVSMLAMLALMALAMRRVEHRWHRQHVMLRHVYL